MSTTLPLLEQDETIESIDYILNRRAIHEHILSTQMEPSTLTARSWRNRPRVRAHGRTIADPTTMRRAAGRDLPSLHINVGPAESHAQASTPPWGRRHGFLCCRGERLTIHELLQHYDEAHEFRDDQEYRSLRAILAAPTTTYVDRVSMHRAILVTQALVPSSSIAAGLDRARGRAIVELRLSQQAARQAFPTLYTNAPRPYDRAGRSAQNNDSAEQSEGHARRLSGTAEPPPPYSSNGENVADTVSGEGRLPPPAYTVGSDYNANRQADLPPAYQREVFTATSTVRSATQLTSASATQTPAESDSAVIEAQRPDLARNPRRNRMLSGMLAVPGWPIAILAIFAIIVLAVLDYTGMFR